MANPEEREKLYKGLREHPNELYTEDFEAFEQQFSDRDQRQRLYEGLKQQELLTDDVKYEDFEAHYFGDIREDADKYDQAQSAADPDRAERISQTIQGKGFGSAIREADQSTEQAASMTPEAGDMATAPASSTMVDLREPEEDDTSGFGPLRDMTSQQVNNFLQSAYQPRDESRPDHIRPSPLGEDDRISSLREEEDRIKEELNKLDIPSSPRASGVSPQEFVEGREKTEPLRRELQEVQDELNELRNSPMENLGAGFRGAWRHAQMQAHGIRAMANEDPEIQERFLRKFAVVQREDLLDPVDVGQIEKIESAGDAANWIAGSLPMIGATLGGIMIPAYVGGKVGSAAGPKGTAVGSTIGGFSSGLGMYAGMMYGNLRLDRDKDGKSPGHAESRNASLLYGSLSSGVSIIGPLGAYGAVRGAFGTNYARSRVRDGMAGIGIAGPAEGAAEGVAENFVMMGEEAVLGREIPEEERRSRTRNAMAQGGMMGVGTGAIGGAGRPQGNIATIIDQFTEHLDAQSQQAARPILHQHLLTRLERTRKESGLTRDQQQLYNYLKTGEADANKPISEQVNEMDKAIVKTQEMSRDERETRLRELNDQDRDAGLSVEESYELTALVANEPSLIDALHTERVTVQEQTEQIEATTEEVAEQATDQREEGVDDEAAPPELEESAEQAEVETGEQIPAERRGRRQVKRGFDALAEAETPEEQIQAIVNIENNTRFAPDAIGSDEAQQVEEIKSQLGEEGFEFDIVRPGDSWNEDSPLSVDFVTDESLPPGEAYIKKIHKPHISKDGELHQTGEAEVVTSPWQSEAEAAEAGVTEFADTEAYQQRLRGEREDQPARDPQREESALSEPVAPEVDVSHLEGSEVTVDFTPDGGQQVPARYAVAEAEDVQASHHPSGEINTNYIIDGAQPRNRSSRDAVEKQDRDANRLNPPRITGNELAFYGAPVVNQNFNSIQGSGRINALKNAYTQYPAQAVQYKQYLLDHAEEFGLQREQIASMNQPVLVRKANVPDAEAVRLGNITNSAELRMSATDEAKATIRNLPEKDKQTIGRMIDQAPGENIREILDQTGRDILDQLSDMDKSQFINNKGELTNEGKTFLEESFKALLFDGGTNRNSIIQFDRLPHTIRRGIERSYGVLIPLRDTAGDLSTTLQKAVEIIDAVQRTDGITTAQEFMQQSDAFDGLNTDIYTSGEANLADYLMRSNTQRQIRELFQQYRNRIYGKEDLFETIEAAGATPEGTTQAFGEVIGGERRAQSAERGAGGRAQGAERGEQDAGRRARGAEGAAPEQPGPAGEVQEPGSAAAQRGTERPERAEAARERSTEQLRERQTTEIVAQADSPQLQRTHRVINQALPILRMSTLQQRREAVRQRYRLNPKEIDRFLDDLQEYSAKLDVIAVTVQNKRSASHELMQAQTEEQANAWEQELNHSEELLQEQIQEITTAFEGLSDVIQLHEPSRDTGAGASQPVDGDPTIRMRNYNDDTVLFIDNGRKYHGVLTDIGAQYDTKAGGWMVDRNRKAEVVRKLNDYHEMAGQRFASALSDPTPDSYNNVPEFTTEQGETKKGRKLLKRFAKDRDGDNIGVRSIVEFLMEVTDADLRIGKTQTSKRYPAHYSTFPHMIRSRVRAWSVNFHEAGHAMSFIMKEDNPNWWSSIESDLVALTYEEGGASAHSAEEGFAEWVRRYIVDRNGLPQSMTRTIEQHMLENHPDLFSGLRDANRMWFQHRTRSIAAQFRSYGNDRGADRGVIAELRDALDNFLYRHISMEHALFRKRRYGFHALRETSLSDAVKEALRGAPKEAFDSYRLSMQVARNFEKTIQDTPADSINSLQSYINAPAEVGRILQGDKSGPDGVRIKNFKEVPLRQQTDEASLHALEEAGYDIPESTAGFGEYIYLSEKSFSQIQNEVGRDNWPWFEVYGWMKESLHRSEEKGHKYQGIRDGLTPEHLRQEVARLENLYPHFEQAFDDVNNLLDQLTLISYFSGEKSLQDMINLKEGIDHYWPLPKQIENAPMTGRIDTSRPDSGINRAYGSEHPIRSLDEAVNMRVRRSIEAYYWNNTLLSVRNYGQRLANDENAPRAARMLGNRIMTRLRMEVEQVATLKPEEGQQIIAEHLNEMLLEQKRETTNNPDAELTDEETIRPEAIEINWNGKGVWRAREPIAAMIVAPFEGGQRHFYQVEDPILFDMFTHTRDPVSFLKWSSNIFQPMVQAWKRPLTHNVIFSGWQFFSRDLPHAMFMGEGPGSVIPGYYHAIGLWNRITKEHKTPLEYGEMLTKAFNATGHDSHKTLVENFMDVLKEGIVLDNYSEMTFWERRAANAGQFFSTLLKPVEMILYMTGQRWLSVQMESIPREGRAIQVAKEGGTRQMQERAYGRLIGNFAMHPGSANTSAFFRLGGFTNPGMQVNYGHLQNLTHYDPVLRSQAWLYKIPWITLTSSAAAAINFLLFTDEEDHKKMRERPDLDRFRYKYLFSGMRFPMDYGITGTAESLGWNLMEGHLLDNPVESRELAKGSLQRMLDIPGHPMTYLNPQILTAIETGADWSFWRQDNIVPSYLETQFPQNPEMQHFESTPESYRRIGEHLSVSPLKVNYAIRNAMGNSTDELIQVMEQLLRKDGDDIQERADIPFVGRLFHRDPVGFRAQSVQSLSELDDDYQAIQQQINQMQRSGEFDMDELRDLYQRAGELSRARGHMQEIRKISRYIRDARSRPDPDQDHIRRLERRMVEIAQMYFDHDELLDEE